MAIKTKLIVVIKINIFYPKMAAGMGHSSNLVLGEFSDG